MKMRNKHWQIFIALFGVLILGGCDQNHTEFALPEGNIEAGKIAFQDLGCHRCHSVAGEIEQMASGEADVQFRIGGTSTRVRSYADLVTSIINPNHRVSRFIGSEGLVDEEGDSRMPSHNEMMSVQQLVDITTFLQTTYDLPRPMPPRKYSP